jgi:hypothetical protein
MPDPPSLPNFQAFRAYVVKELYGSAALPKVLDWATKMEEWAKARIEEAKRIEQLERQVSDFEEALSQMNNYEEVALLAADVKRGIRDLDELMEVVG